MQSILLFCLATFVVVASLALTLGLTWLPCYSVLCVEENFPVQVRTHVVYYYICLALTVFFLILRKNVAKIHTLSGTISLNKIVTLHVDETILWRTAHEFLGSFGGLFTTVILVYTRNGFLSRTTT